MNRLKLFLALAAVIAFTSAAQADLGLALGVKGGSLGGGVELTKSIWGKFNVRAAMNQLPYTMEDSLEDKDMKYETEINLSSWSVIVDYHPWNGVFHLSGGVINNGNNFVTRMSSTKTYTIGGRSLTPDDQGELEVAIDWEPMAPYIGIGWGNPVEKGKFFGINVDFGAMLQNSPNIEMKGTKMMAAMEAEEATLEKHLKGAKTWIVASLGFSFHIL